MRHYRRGLLILAGLFVLLAVAYGLVWNYGRSPAKATVGITGWQVTGEVLEISVSVTNTGHTPLIWYGQPSFTEVRIKTDQGWKSVPQSYLSKTGTLRVLLPGNSLNERCSCPRNIEAFQVICPFETAGARVWSLQRLPVMASETKWIRYPYPMLEQLLLLLPNGKGEDVGFSSPVVHIP